LAAIERKACYFATHMVGSRKNPLTFLKYHLIVKMLYYQYQFQKGAEMKTKKLNPFYILPLFILGVGLACNLGAGGTKEAPTMPSERTATLAPSETVEVSQPFPTPEKSLPTKIPRPTATAGPVEFYTEEFDTDPGSNWSFFVISGKKSSDESKVSTTFEDGKMVFDIDDEELYAYYMYEPYSYTDVSLDMQAENRGKNTNNVSLVCRQNGEEWYEFSITSGGLWVLYAHDQDGYQWLGNGGTTALHMGKDVNEFSMNCQGKTITMSVNGIELKSITDNTYKYREGGVGFNISSLDVIPVTVGVDWVKISEP
jgi:hypothetical protein